jgi:hypothetical protein
MQDDGDVLARFDHFVEIADAAITHGPRQGTVDPDRLATLEKKATGEVCGSEVIVAGDGGERQGKLLGHMADEASLATAGRTFQQER